MKVLFRIWVVLILLIPATGNTQEGQPGAVTGTISKKGFEAIPLIIPKPMDTNPEAAPASDELKSVLTDDLTNSDFFDVIDASPFPAYDGGSKVTPWKTSTAKYAALMKVGLTGDQVNVEARFYDLQSEQLVVGKIYKWDRKFVRQIAHRFGDEILLRLWGVKGLFTSRIAYSSDRSGNRDVWIMDYDGYNQQAITVSKTLNLSPDLSPDGKKVVFTSYRTAEGTIGQNLVVYFIYEGKKVNLFGGGTLNSAPAWSPDGKRVAFTSNVKGNTDIYEINADGSGLRQITFTRGIDTSPAWNPRSGEIAFTSDRSGAPMIYVMNEDGTNERRLTFVGEYNESAAWSPDGTKLAYVSRSGAIFDIYVIDMQTTVVTRLTQNEGSNENPCWSPDSRHIAFSSNRTGRYQVWTMLFDGTRPRQLTRDGNNTSPSWAAGSE
ncbi:MAG TPA: Tol-Pal system beta propeller repeat protein TolB [Acidobacteriota bacterium]|nr:Tol-Pal system beta propeller repeat protein TolB [Acidobacteriota bacterium]